AVEAKQVHHPHAHSLRGRATGALYGAGWVVGVDAGEMCHRPEGTAGRYGHGAIPNPADPPSTTFRGRATCGNHTGTDAADEFRVQRTPGDSVGAPPAGPACVRFEKRVGVVRPLLLMHASCQKGKRKTGIDTTG